MTLASLLVPEWISWDTESVRLPNPCLPPSQRSGMSDSLWQNTAKHIHHSYGLHTRCNSISATCTPFPRAQDCKGPEASFCALWKSSAFLMSLAFLVELVTLLAFLISLFGSKHRQAQGWRVVVLFLVLSAASQIGAMGIMSYLFEDDDRFSIPGWRLDKGWALCTSSWVIQLLVGAGVIAATALMAEEGGYELISDALGDRRGGRGRDE